ncbi:hypothetical protein [Kineosporia sp. NBRC 101731]|nr:hypothetical protein [Kineosporia sp. NBRC 101731]GLY29409.1 hypothetical protein Kisp02_27740 [Kineosporia sp. NBRC 101731]
MQLTFDVISRGMPDVAAAQTFDTDALTPVVTDAWGDAGRGWFPRAGVGP